MEHAMQCLRPLVSGDFKLGDLYYFCVQFCQTTNQNRLAQLWRVLGLYGGAVYRDVWLSADHLSFVRLAAKKYPGVDFLAMKMGICWHTILGL